MLFILFVLCLVCVYAYTRLNRVRRFADKIPGETPLPLIGNALDVGTDPVDFLQWLMRLWEKHNRGIYGAWMGLEYFVILTEPEDVEVIMSSMTHISKFKDYAFLEPWLGKGLLTSTGNKWRHSRKIITPTFHFKILEQYAKVFNSCGDVLIEKLRDKADGQIINIYNFVSLSALDVVTESAMGIKINAQDDSSSAFVQAIYDISLLIMQRGFSAWKRIDALFRLSSSYKAQENALAVIKTFNEKVILERAQILRQNNNSKQEEGGEEDDAEIKKKTAFLDMLLTSTIDGKNLPDQMIADEVATFMFEGHDTTTSALAFGLYAFSINPDIQQKAFQEQISIFGNDKKKHPDYQDYQEMKYLDRYIKETLRIYPSVPIIGRQAEEDININGKIVPASTNLSILIYAMNHNPKYHADPEKFDPDRFLPENRMNKHPYEYIPFSAGPRNCIGQKFAVLEIKSIFSKMLRNYQILPAGPEHAPIVYAELTLKSKNGIKIKLAPREY